MMKEKRAKLIWLIAALSVFGIACSSGCYFNNSDPVIDGLYAEFDSLFVGQDFAVVAVASDPDGDNLKYQWFVSKGDISGEGSRITWTAPMTSGAYTISVKVTDDRGGESTMTLTLGVVSNTPPVIVSLKAEDTGCRRNAPVVLDCIAYDHDGDELIYQWTVTGGEIKGDGPLVSWIAPDELGTFTITVQVSDGRGGEVEESLDIEVEGG
ncbi:MAG: hypothetical protein IMY81_00875 [Chloroflexi bacterium]|nr:hypothetical protein [Chloroflexota bacterium]